MAFISPLVFALLALIEVESGGTSTALSTINTVSKYNKFGAGKMGYDLHSTTQVGLISSNLGQKSVSSEFHTFRTNSSNRLRYQKEKNGFRKLELLEIFKTNALFLRFTAKKMMTILLEQVIGTPLMGKNTVNIPQCVSIMIKWKTHQTKLKNIRSNSTSKAQRGI